MIKSDIVDGWRLGSEADRRPTPRRWSAGPLSLSVRALALTMVEMPITAPAGGGPRLLRYVDNGRDFLTQASRSTLWRKQREAAF
jgi:hypothetical protein